MSWLRDIYNPQITQRNITPLILSPSLFPAFNVSIVTVSPATETDSTITHSETATATCDHTEDAQYGDELFENKIHGTS